MYLLNRCFQSSFKRCSNRFRIVFKTIVQSNIPNTFFQNPSTNVLFIANTFCLPPPLSTALAIATNTRYRTKYPATILVQWSQTQRLRRRYPAPAPRKKETTTMISGPAGSNSSNRNPERSNPSNRNPEGSNPSNRNPERSNPSNRKSQRSCGQIVRVNPINPMKMTF